MYIYLVVKLLFGVWDLLAGIYQCCILCHIHTGGIVDHHNLGVWFASHICVGKGAGRRGEIVIFIYSLLMTSLDGTTDTLRACCVVFHL